MSDHAISNARGWLATIVELVARLNEADSGESKECGQCEGTGTTQSASNLEDEECPVCDGSGYIDSEETADDIRQEIDEGPLSVQVRGGWHSPGDTEGQKPEEYEILLSTGGPALRIVGDLDEYGQPWGTPRLQWQDWGTPWTDYNETTCDDDQALSTYVGCFYYGE